MNHTVITRAAGPALISAIVLAGTGCTSTSQERAREGILVMAHGGDAHWDRDVQEVVAPLREKYPVEIAFGMAQTSTIRQAVQCLEQQGVRRVAVVRMFISGESFLPETEYILGLRPELAHCHSHGHHGGGAGGHKMEPPEPIGAQARIVLSREGVSESPLIEDILVERVRHLSRDPAGESVLILAHGPGDDGENQRWLARMNQRAAKVRVLGFREVRCETLREDWPDKRLDAEHRIQEFVQQGNHNGGRVIVIPFRVAGFGPYREVLKGLDYIADGRGFCPHPNMTRWIEQTARRCLKSDLPVVREAGDSNQTGTRLSWQNSAALMSGPPGDE
ncbi:MAG: hypothetical protein AMXMBFR13_43070 [Phycisphaerae bacterium]